MQDDLGDGSDFDNPAPMRHDPVDPYRCYVFGPTHDGQNSKPFRTFFSEQEVKLICGELDRFFSAYKTKYILATTHAAPSPTWRDESLADVHHWRLSRFATRVHVFEQASGTRSEHGRYLGFICLRPLDRRQQALPDPGFQYVIEAELVKPAHMHRPRYHLIQTTASSPRLGVLPFISTVFISPRQGVESSTCVHLAISQALHLIMGRFGSKPISQREFEFYLWQMNADESLEDLAERGARPREALQIISEHSDTGGFIVDISELGGELSELEIWRESHRVLTDCLANGLPVILMVDHKTLIPPLPGRQPPSEDLPHAALVFGMRLLHSGGDISPSRAGRFEASREDQEELPGIFVGHDSIKGPYVEWTAKHLLDAALACPSIERKDQIRYQGEGIRFLALGPKGLKIGLHQVRKLARKIAREDAENNPELYKEYFHQYADTNITHAESCEADPYNWRFVTRLLSIHQVCNQYFQRYSSEEEARQAMVNFLKKKDEIVEDVQPWIDQAGYFWAVELLLPVYKKTTSEGVRNQPLRVYLWSIADEYGNPRATLLWDGPKKQYLLK
jgi:hypothetical protein